MPQNSLSSVVKSRMSSSSGRTMSVENRSLAWTGTMSSFAYFTTRAAVSVVAGVGGAPKAAVPRATTGRMRRNKLGLCLQKIRFIEMLLLKWFGLVGTFVHGRKNLDEPLHRKEECSGGPE